MTASIEAKGVRISFPIMNSSHRSLKKVLLNATTGGRVASDSRNHVIVTAVDGVSFRINPGERVALVGHNGSGKTTLLRSLAGVYTPVAGELNVQGSISSLLDVGLGMDHEATGEENIFLRGTMMGLSRAKIESLFDDIASFAELGEFLKVPVRTYSSGMQLRLAFSISTSVRADIILMDEWLSVGDSNFSKKATQRLNELVEQSAILVIATHSSDLVAKLCTREIHMAHGTIISDQVIATEAVPMDSREKGVNEG